MTIADAAFEAKHPRRAGGRFTDKVNAAPASPLIDGRIARVTEYRGEPIASRVGMPPAPVKTSMILGEDQAGDVWTFAEEHLLENGSFLTSVHYVYPAHADPASFTVATETEQFVSDHPGAYAAVANLDRDEALWHRYDSAPVVCSPERAASLARRAADDAHLHQTYFTETVPWTGEPLAETAGTFRATSEQLNKA